MCVGISPPCSKCGAPARWKVIQSTTTDLSDRVMRVIEYVKQLEDCCPARNEILRILEGGKGG